MKQLESAFPYFGHTGWSTNSGMTLRDYFAIRASEEDIQNHLLTGRVIDVVLQDGTGRKTIEQRPEYRTREQARYAFADSMMEARNMKLATGNC